MQFRLCIENWTQILSSENQKALNSTIPSDIKRHVNLASEMVYSLKVAEYFKQTIICSLREIVTNVDRHVPEERGC